MDLAVLLRNCPHDNNATSTTKIRYALKCDNMSMNIAKTPIQIPIPSRSPELIDLGIFRPSITLSGTVDNVGQASGTTTGFEHMEAISVTRPYWASATSYTTTNATQTYYIPYKNKLEETIYKWMAADDVELELEIGDASFPIYATAAELHSSGINTHSSISSKTETGGGLYTVAIQSCRFQVDAAKEDRWQFQMQFICKSRSDVKFT